jgi:hypothetical protein
MNPTSIDKKIDEAADAAKRVVAKIEETRLAADELADAAIANAQTAITQASKKGEHRLTETVTKAAHRIEETVARIANRAEEWADRAAAGGNGTQRPEPLAGRRLTGADA